MKNSRTALDMGGEIPHIILCNMTIEKAEEIISKVLGDNAVYFKIPGCTQITATTWDGEPYVFILQDIIEEDSCDF